ncbi:DUF397 domain-containing protein [Actinomadura viridis]|uniref:DUF397 domain-containing protein n=1 Tax=Actinomadura viridis TaxID=58110 RepID=UPI0036A9E9AB
MTWRKARWSNDQGGNCVELAGWPGVVAVRDSKDPQGSRLELGRAEFRALVAELKRL